MLPLSSKRLHFNKLHIIVHYHPLKSCLTDGGLKPHSALKSVWFSGSPLKKVKQPCILLKIQV